MSRTADTREYTVQGMTCGHCAVSVREEVSALAAVRGAVNGYEVV